MSELVKIEIGDIAFIKLGEYTRSVARSFYRHSIGFVVTYKEYPYFMILDGRNATLHPLMGYYKKYCSVCACVSDELYEYLSSLKRASGIVEITNRSKMKIFHLEGMDSYRTDKGIVWHYGDLGFCDHDEYCISLQGVKALDGSPVPEWAIEENEDDGRFHLKSIVWQLYYSGTHQCLYGNGLCEFDYPCYHFSTDSISTEMLYEVITKELEVESFADRTTLINQAKKHYSDDILYFDYLSNRELLALLGLHEADPQRAEEVLDYVTDNIEYDNPLFSTDNVLK